MVAKAVIVSPWAAYTAVRCYFYRLSVQLVLVGPSGLAGRVAAPCLGGGGGWCGMGDVFEGYSPAWRTRGWPQYHLPTAQDPCWAIACGVSCPWGRESLGTHRWGSSVLLRNWSPVPGWQGIVLSTSPMSGGQLPSFAASFLFPCHSVLIGNLFGSRDSIDFICLLTTVILGPWTHMKIKSEVTNFLSP